METILRREIIVNRATLRVIGVALFVILTSLGAFVRIPLPFTPVPVTLQTFFVLLGAASLGSGLGALVQASYILLGVSGLTIFTGAGSGLLYLFGPTGGYLFGFVLASLFIGRLIKYAKNSFLLFGTFCAADFILLLTGTIWLKFILGCTFTKALLIGLTPFIPGDILKALAASGIYLKLRSRMEKRGESISW